VIAGPRIGATFRISGSAPGSTPGRRPNAAARLGLEARGKVPPGECDQPEGRCRRRPDRTVSEMGLPLRFESSGGDRRNAAVAAS
jgi:hypothetical protein